MGASCYCQQGKIAGSCRRFPKYRTSVTPPEGVKNWDGRMNHPDDDQRRDIRNAYLEPWTAYGSLPQLHEAFSLSRYLNEVYQAVRWYLEIAYLEPGCPWYNEVVGGYIGYLRRLLDMEADLPR